MTAGLLMLGALFSNANATDPAGMLGKTVDLAKADDLKAYYYVGLPDGTALLKADATTKEGYTSLAAVNVSSDWATMDDEAKDECLFSISALKDGAGKIKWFKLTSKATGQDVVFKLDGTNVKSIEADDDADVAKTYFSSIAAPTEAAGKIEIETGTGVNFLPYTGGVTANTYNLTLATTGITWAAADAKLQFFAVSNTELTDAATALNGVRNSFSFGEIKDVKNHLFQQTVKAFTLIEITVNGDYKIPAGTYFATDYSALENGTITTADDFNKCTFIALSSTDCKLDKDNQKAGKGFVLTTVSGKDFNFYTGEEAAKKSQGTQVSINNANFTVITNLNEESEGVYNYALQVKNFRYKKESDKNDHGQGSFVIAATKLDDKSTVLASTSGNPAFIFVKDDAPIAKPINLLNDSTASVYNILFKSGKATEENGKYLSVYSDGTSAFDFFAQGTAVATLSNPQYQFVISAVDEEENTITFTNREAKSISFTVVLDTTTTAGVYNIVSENNSDQFTIIDPKVAVNATQDFAGTTIQLIPATVDKFAGFADRGENAGYTFITFAKNGNASEKWYMPAPASSSSLGVATATKKESLAGLWEFVKSEDPVMVRQDYMYEKDGVAVTKTLGDTLAYYTYAIKLIDPEMENYYLNATGTAVEQKDGTSGNEPSRFVIKENKDGSVSIVAAPTGSDFLTYDAASLSMSDMLAISLGGEAYKNAVDADAIKVFLVAEKLGASLEAEPQHVAFEAETGGFLALSANNEGIVAIKTAANEDLTFWLDTADSKATLPSFYISKGVKATKATDAERLFMFYATDSVGYVTENDPFVWGTSSNTKVIFKAATLVNPDTLATTVNGKAANVAMKADANGTLGGLANFKYQIFKSDDAEDSYVVRSADGYLTSINNQLTLNGSKEDAIRLYVTSQEAPTANEATPSVSEVKVIAAEGAIRIAGAQGKKVVISNILGQVIANTVISSSDATIAAPAGIVVVAVEGEEAVKAIVKG